MDSNDHSKSLDDQKLNGGPWNQQQCLKYLIFLDQNKIVMASRQKKKRFRVFDQMSEFIQTRSSLQCRSHHQKALEKFKQVKDIISHQKILVDLKDYRLRVKELRLKAKVRENYEKFIKPKVIKDYVQSDNQMKEATVDEFPLKTLPVMENYFNSMPGYPLQMIQMTPNPILGGYFYYPYFFQN